jgi:hypothetical protein
MRIIVPLFIVIAVFAALDKGLGLIASTRTNSKQVGQEMYRMAEEFAGEKPRTTRAKTRIGITYQRIALKIARIEKGFEAKYTPLYSFLDKTDWFEDRGEMLKCARLARTWAKDGLAVWKKEMGLQRQLLADVATQARISQARAENHPTVVRSKKMFAMYHRLYDVEGRRYFDLMGKLMEFTAKNHASMKTVDGLFYWEKKALDSKRMSLGKAAVAAQDKFAKAATAFYAERDAIRAEAMRNVRAQL